jgi:tungstate transport system ATP-binding protein
MKMTQISYKLNQIRHYYGDKKVLDIDGLQIAKSSITGLTGPNGSGKSTLLKIMAFALKPSVGEVFFNGRKEFVLSPRVRSRVTLLTQKPYLLKRSVFENIAYGLKIRKDLGNLNRTFTKEVTKEIWIYGLDGKDNFVVKSDRVIVFLPPPN